MTVAWDRNDVRWDALTCDWEGNEIYGVYTDGLVSSVRPGLLNTTWHDDNANARK